MSTRPVDSFVRFLGLVVCGTLLWVLGLATLGVSADLPAWRHGVGAFLLICAVNLWCVAWESDDD